jgi:hypothetical protein
MFIFDHIDQAFGSADAVFYFGRQLKAEAV